jgi:segregation and condensation protein A
MEYTVQLDNFAGPLDLLLYLIKQEEVAIHDISLGAICNKYLAHVRAMKDLDVNVSAEFLVVAATLMLIKSRSLLPREDEVDLDEELDPEDELIQQLLEYKKFKMATRDLSEMADLRSRIFPYLPPPTERGEREIPLEDLDVYDLVRAFARILKETKLDHTPRLLRDEKPLRVFVEEVFSRLRDARKMRFVELFDDTHERETVIGRFIALLELTRRGRIRIAQPGSYDEIEIEVLDDRDLSEQEYEVMEAEMTAPPPPSDDELPPAPRVESSPDDEEGGDETSRDPGAALGESPQVEDDSRPARASAAVAELLEGPVSDRSSDDDSDTASEAPASKPFRSRVAHGGDDAAIESV